MPLPRQKLREHGVSTQRSKTTIWTSSSSSPQCREVSAQLQNAITVLYDFVLLSGLYLRTENPPFIIIYPSAMCIRAQAQLNQNSGRILLVLGLKTARLGSGCGTQCHPPSAVTSKCLLLAPAISLPLRFVSCASPRIYPVDCRGQCVRRRVLMQGRVKPSSIAVHYMAVV